MSYLKENLLRAPHLTHQRVSGNIVVLMRRHLEGNPLGEIFVTPGITFDECESMKPDLVFVCHIRQEALVRGNRFIGAPDS